MSFFFLSLLKPFTFHRIVSNFNRGWLKYPISYLRDGFLMHENVAGCVAIAVGCNTIFPVIEYLVKQTILTYFHFRIIAHGWFSYEIGLATIWYSDWIHLTTCLGLKDNPSIAKQCENATASVPKSIFCSSEFSSLSNSMQHQQYFQLVMDFMRDYLRKSVLSLFFCKEQQKTKMMELKMCKLIHVHSIRSILYKQFLVSLEWVRWTTMNTVVSIRKWWPYNLIALCRDFILFAFYSVPFDRITCWMYNRCIIYSQQLTMADNYSRSCHLSTVYPFERWLIPDRTKWKTNLPFDTMNSVVCCMKKDY